MATIAKLESMIPRYLFVSSKDHISNKVIKTFISFKRKLPSSASGDTRSGGTLMLVGIYAKLAIILQSLNCHWQLLILALDSHKGTFRKNNFTVTFNCLCTSVIQQMVTHFECKQMTKREKCYRTNIWPNR